MVKIIAKDKKQARKTGLKRTAAILIAAVAMVGGYFAFLQLSGNFNTVIEGELYRSAQPSASQLERYVKRYGVKTIINLRGADRADWHSQEAAVAKALGVAHIDFRMSSSTIVTKEDADQLIAMMKDAPKPILIHCRAGADRSGLVAAIYSRAIAKRDEEDAEGQLSLLFGHIGVPYLSSAYAMDQSWELFEDYYKDDDQPRI